MPGAIPHLLAGCAMFVVGLLVFHTYFKGRTREKVYLLLVCLLFSLIPDFVLALYYIFDFSSFRALLPYHVELHYIIIPFTLVILLLLFVTNVRRKPIWIMGCFCILLHIGMDLIIPESGVLL